MKLRLHVKLTSDESFAWEHSGHAVRVGRNPACELVIQGDASKYVSWEHTRLEIRPDGLHVNDLGSSNGTFVNDQRIGGWTRLDVGDDVGLGLTGPRLKILEVDRAEPIPVRQPMVAASPFGFVQGQGAAVSHSAVERSRPERFPNPVERHSPAQVTDHEPRTMQLAHAGNGGASPFGNPKSITTPSATRALVISMQSSHRKLWTIVALAASVALMIATATYLALSGHLGQVIAKTDELSTHTSNLSDQVSKTREKMEEITKGDADSIFRDNSNAVYLVARRASGSRVIPMGTAFVVNTSGRFATNAHVTASVREKLARGEKTVVLSQGGTHEYAIVDATSHPLYKPDGRTPDVGVLTVRLPEGANLTAVTLASEAELRQLQPGVPLCYIGFPVYDEEHLSDYNTISKVNARVYQGHLTRLLTLSQERGDFPTQYLLEHDMYSWGGSSGSPVFDRHGKVVAAHFSGTTFQGKRAAAGPKWGMRADLLNTLLGKQ